MSTLKATNLQHKDSTNPNVVLYADGSTSIRDLQNLAPNLIINGAMNVAQRSTSTSGVDSQFYATVDRFSNFIGSIGAWDDDQDTDAPAGFSFSKKLTCTAGNSSPPAAGRLNVSYAIEANDLASIRASSGFRSLSFSFWVKSNRTGTASVNVYQPDNSNRIVVLTYDISAAGTWEKIDITIPADASGVINADNGAGLVIEWWLNSGSNFQGGVAQPDWGALVDANRNIQNLGVGGAANDYFALTGVQLTATDAPIEFQHEDYGTTLAKCRRYYQTRKGSSPDLIFCNVASYNSASLYGCYDFDGVMRAAPTVTTEGVFKVYRAGDTVDATSVSFQRVSNVSCRINVTAATTANAAAWVEPKDPGTSAINLSAEL